MRIKNINFNQPIRLLINDKPFNFSNKLSGRQQVFNKGFIKYEDVIPFNLTGIDTIEKFTLFPKFSRVEHYYGDDLFYLGFIKRQSGSANPNKPKHITIDVLDGKDWLTQSELIDQVYIRKSYHFILLDLMTKINLPFIKLGKIQFDKDAIMDSWDSDEVDAYSVLRFIEKQTDTILVILLENDKTYSINFFSKERIMDRDGNRGVDLKIDNSEEFKEFSKKYKIIDINWNLSNLKNFNIARVSSEKIISSIPIKEQIELSISNTSYSLFENVGYFDNNNCALKKSSGEKIRKIKIIEMKNVAKGYHYDIAFSQESNVIQINPKLLKTTNILELEFFPINRGTVQFENNQDQREIATYTKGTGRKSRYEKHNDAGNKSTLIKYAKHYLNLGIENQMELKIQLEKPPWNLGEYLEVKINPNELNGIYYVKDVVINFINNQNGLVDSTYLYTLSKTRDFEDNAINFYDDQSYRQKPVFDQTKTLTSFENIHINLRVVGQPGLLTYDVERIPKNYLQSQLQMPLGTEEQPHLKGVLQKELQGEL